MQILKLIENCTTLRRILKNLTFQTSILISLAHGKASMTSQNFDFQWDHCKKSNFIISDLKKCCHMKKCTLFWCIVVQVWTIKLKNCSFRCSASEKTSKDVNDLVREIKLNCSRHFRPLVNQSDVIEVKPGFGIHQIKNMDVVQQVRKLKIDLLLDLVKITCLETNVEN